MKHLKATLISHLVVEFLERMVLSSCFVEPLGFASFIGLSFMVL
jgi:hypothetical protein